MNRLINILSLLKITRILKFLLRILADRGIVWPFVFIYSKVLKDVVPEDGTVPGGCPTILAINPGRFFGELESLANSKKLRVLKIPFDWQVRLLAIYWPTTIDWDWKRYFNPDGNTDKDIIELQRDLRAFLRKFLSSLYKRMGIDCVIGATFYYAQDYDWGLVSNEIGSTFIVVQTDRVFGSANKSYVMNRLVKPLEKFKGNHIITLDKDTAEILIQEGYVTSDRISSLGATRMDDFVKRVKQLRKSNDRQQTKNGRKKVTLFSFLPCVGLRARFKLKTFPDTPGVGYQKLFENVHVAIAKLAANNRDIDFVVKTKWGGIWFEGIERVCRENGIDISKIPNLTITGTANVHKLIFDSDVICAFSSMTLLEAGIASKPVVIPLFDEASRPEYQESMAFFDCYRLFDCAENVTEFEKLILDRLDNPGSKTRGKYLIEKETMFEKHVSSMEGNSLEKYVTLINQLINKSKERKSLMTTAL